MRFGGPILASYTADPGMLFTRTGAPHVAPRSVVVLALILAPGRVAESGAHQTIYAVPSSRVAMTGANGLSPLTTTLLWPQVTPPSTELVAMIFMLKGALGPAVT